MRTLFGLLILLLGVGLLLDATGVYSTGSVISLWWPIVIIAVGIMSWRSNPRMIFGPGLIILFGVIVLLDILNVLPGNVWNAFWPLVIILFGLRILVGKTWTGPQAHEGDGREVFAAFSGREERVQGAFQSGRASAWFGGTKLDLRQATIVDGATLEVFAAFGGIEILLPTSVKADVHVTPLFGGSDNKAHADATATATVRITGTALFGGVDVKN